MLDNRLLTELAHHREEGKSWWSLVRDARATTLSSSRRFRFLNSYSTYDAWSHPPSTRAHRHPTGYIAVIANLPGAERREADWRGFRELVRILARGSENAFAVVRWPQRLLEAGGAPSRPPLEAGGAVTLTTVCGSKGLRWSV